MPEAGNRTAYTSQHYTPVVYLRQFTSRKPRNQLWEYDLTDGSVQQSSPKESGCEDFYNSVALKDGGQDDEIVEKAFHALENELPQLFEAVRNKHMMSEQLWSLFFTFVATQETRCPAIVRTIDDFQSKISQMGFEMLCKSSPKFQKSLAAMGLTPQAALDKYEMKSAKGSAILLSIEAMETTSALLTRMKWGLLCAPEGESFFTSDRPLCVWVPPEKRNIYSGALTDRDAEFTFPLSRRICACGHWTKTWPGTYNKISPDLLHAINRRTVKNAYRYAYGPTRDIRLPELVQARAGNRAESCQSTQTN